jgi:putative Ca2+/H+ antiporter (TMEM165/GDT1 family)
VEAFLTSTGIVALAEIGDKTQLLALLLALRFRKPAPIIAAILVATLVNHALAGALGAWITTVVPPQAMRWILAGSFLAMAIWALVPDKLDETEAPRESRGSRVFVVTFVAFFLAEIGDKTQIATVAMAAHYPEVLLVVAGTTLGMMIANVPAVFAAESIAARVPLRLIRAIAAAMFVVLAVLTMLR